MCVLSGLTFLFLTPLPQIFDILEILACFSLPHTFPAWSCDPNVQIFEILEIPEAQWPTWSHESGQMLIDKRRHWRGLLLCM